MWLEFFKAIFVVVFLLILAMSVGFFMWKVWKRSLMKYRIKYGLFRRKIKEEDQEFCYTAIQNGWDEVQVKKFLLLNDYDEEKIDEITYFFRAMLKQLKGGVANGKKERS